MSRLLTALMFLVSLAYLQAADDPRLALLNAADDTRVAAMKAPSPEVLTALLSEELHYAHSNGAVDSKKSLIETLVDGKLRYSGLDYETRNFSFPTADMALMTGRVRVKAKTATAEIDATMSFLGVWKLENSRWHFLAWQSCKIPEPGKK